MALRPVRVRRPAVERWSSGGGVGGWVAAPPAAQYGRRVAAVPPHAVPLTADRTSAPGAHRVTARRRDTAAARTHRSPPLASHRSHTLTSDDSSESVSVDF